MSVDTSVVAEVIERATGLRIRSCAIVDSLSGNLVVQVNEEWIFRFPAGRTTSGKTQKQLAFLASFAKRSPVAVPDPVYITDTFLGYKRIVGEPFSPADPFSPSELARLRDEDKRRIAKQLGVFLATLHRSEVADIDFDTGYLSMRSGFDRACPEMFKPYLRTDERKRLDARLAAVADIPANFDERASIIHGDLYFGNILWDKNGRAITGVIDWSEMGRGIPAMDFIGLADFTTNRNDQFLRDILHWYEGADGLFDQVKANAIIEVMNWLWFYEAREDSTGIARAVERLKATLSA